MDVKHQLYKQIKGGIPVPLFPCNKLACSPVPQKSEICPIVKICPIAKGNFMTKHDHSSLN